MQKVDGIEKEYYSVIDLQNILGCGRSKAYSIVREATFPKTRIGGTYYINRAEFEKWKSRNLYSEIKLWK